jgi:transposase InsO family protein
MSQLKRPKIEEDDLAGFKYFKKIAALLERLHGTGCAKRPNHVWHVDLTAVPIVAGFAVPWLPFSLPQCWPFWWVGVVVDHFSRRVMGMAVFDRPPSSRQVRQFLTNAIRQAGQTPKYIICDKGTQFWCDGFKAWCKRRKIQPRFGAVGQHGSIAVVERFIRTLKTECTRRLLMPMRREAFRHELSGYAEWFNQHRPHEWLGGRTPNEVYHNLRPANRAPRWEPRSRWPRGSPCAKPQTLIKGQPGQRLELAVTFQTGRKHQPVVTLKRVA